MRLRSFFIALAAAGALLAGVTGCSDSDPVPDGPTPPPVPSDATFQIFLNNITFLGVDISIQPSDPAVSYHSHILAKEAFARNWSSDVDIFMADYIDYLCQEEGLTLPEVVSNLCVTGNDAWSYYEMEPETEYVVFAVGLDANGKRTTEIFLKELTSASEEPVVMHDCTFDVDVTDIGKTNATVTVSPSDKQLPYYFEAIRYDEYAASSDKRSLVTDYVWTQLMNRVYNEYISLNEAIESITWVGDGNTPLPAGVLRPGTKYVLVACGIDRYGRLNTEITEHEFETEAVIPSMNTFEIAVSNVTATNARVRVTASNNDPYFAGFLIKKYYDGLSDEQLVSQLELEGQIFDAFEGSTTFDAEQMLVPDTDYLVIAVGYDEAATTAVTREEFRTLAGGDPEACSFTFQVDWDIFQGRMQVTPSEKAVFYYFDILSAGAYKSDEEAKNAVESMLRVMQVESGLPMETVLLQLCYRDKDNVEFPTESLTDYIVYALALTNDGKAAGAVYKQNFQSPERIVSSAKAEITCSGYYNGAELYAFDPVAYRGGLDPDGNPYAYTPAVVTHNADAVTWYAGSFGQDLMSKSDAAIVKNLIQWGGGSVNSDKLSTDWTYFNDVTYYGASGMVNTFCAIALDKDGNYGPLFKQLFVPVLSGVSPISEITGGAPSEAGVPMIFREEPVRKPVSVVPANASGNKVSAEASSLRGQNRTETLLQVDKSGESVSRTARYGAGRLNPKR